MSQKLPPSQSLFVPLLLLPFNRHSITYIIYLYRAEKRINSRRVEISKYINSLRDEGIRKSNDYENQLISDHLNHNWGFMIYLNIPLRRIFQKHKSFLGNASNSETLQNWLIPILGARSYVSWMLIASNTKCLASKVSCV